MSLHRATSSPNLGKRSRAPSERVILAAEAAPSKRRKKNPTPKPLVTRFEEEIRALYSKDRMSAKDIAQLPSVRNASRPKMVSVVPTPAITLRHQRCHCIDY